jgi:hypothetical protein
MSEGLFGLYIGTVVDVDDPANAFRVKVYIPGICEPTSAWARGFDLFGSGKDFGKFGPPPEGSQVGVFFEAGDIDCPWFIPTGCAQDEIVSDVAGTLNKWGFAFGDIRLQFEVGLTGLGKVTIYSAKIPEANRIIVDGETNSITIQALTDVTIQAVGRVNITAGLLTLQGRVVTPGGKPI